MDEDGSNQIKLTDYSYDNIYKGAYVEDIYSKNQKILFTQFIHDSTTHKTRYINFTMDIHGKNIKSLNNSVYRPFHPKFSLDGLFIVFKGTENVDDLYIMKSDGSNIKNITNDNVNDGFPHFSSNSEEIIYLSENDIYTINFDGSNKAKLNTTDNVYGSNFCVSKDGSKIVYISSSKIYMINSNSRDNEMLIEAGVCYKPMISNDNSKIAFVSWMEDGYENGYNIKIFDIETRNDVIVANTLRPANDYWRPNILFTPDDESIIFTRYHNDNLEIFMVDIDGSNLHNLTNSPDDEILGQIYIEN
ncbi:MAG: TolB family protein [Thiohalospira sp.]